MVGEGLTLFTLRRVEGLMLNGLSVQRLSYRGLSPVILGSSIET